MNAQLFKLNLETKCNDVVLAYKELVKYINSIEESDFDDVDFDEVEVHMLVQMKRLVRQVEELTK